MSDGWFDDPSGRFTERWFDGADWTDHVRDRDGRPSIDASFRTPGAPTASRPAPSRVEHAPPVPSAPASVDIRRGPGPGILLSGAGIVLTALSLLLLPWAPDTTFLDIRDAITAAGSDVDRNVEYFYIVGAGFVLFAASGVSAILAGLGVPRRRSRPRLFQVLTAVIAGATLVLHVITVRTLFEGPISPDAGAWARSGWLCPHRRRRGIRHQRWRHARIHTMRPGTPVGTRTDGASRCARGRRTLPIPTGE